MNNITVDLGDLFLVSDVGEVTSFSLVLFSGKHDFQWVTQSVFTEEQALNFQNILLTIADRVGIPIDKLRTIVIEPFDEAGDREMFEALVQGKAGTHKNVSYLTRLKSHDEIKEIHRLFMSDTDANRNMASAMLLGSINDTLGALISEG